jgi:hypothetical protein
MPSGSSKKTEGWELNGTHQLLVYAGVSNLLRENINFIKGKHKALLVRRLV